MGTDGGGGTTSNDTGTARQDTNTQSNTTQQDMGFPQQDSGGGLDQPCMPGERSCVDNTTLRLCRPDGSGYDTGVCNNA